MILGLGNTIPSDSVRQGLGGGGGGETKFVMEVTIPSDGYTVKLSQTTTAVSGINYNVDWGDGNTDSGNTAMVSHVYDTGVYDIKVDGNWSPRLQLDTPTRNVVTKLKNWGKDTTTFLSFNLAFRDCVNMEYEPTDYPTLNLTAAIQASYVFLNVTTPTFTGVLDISNWDLSGTTTTMIAIFSTSFDNASGFTMIGNTINASATSAFVANFADGLADGEGDININNVTWTNSNSMTQFFTGAKGLNNVNNWTLKASGTVDMYRAFYKSHMKKTVTTLDLSGWSNTSNITRMHDCFRDVDFFDASGAQTDGILDITSWNFSSVNSLYFCFYTSKFTEIKGLSGLNTINGANLTGNNVAYMFGICNDLSFDNSDFPATGFFNNLGNCANFQSMFQQVGYSRGAGNYGKAPNGIAGLDSSSATILNNMFYRARFDTPIDISSWDLSSATTMVNTFRETLGTTTLDFSNSGFTNALNTMNSVVRQNADVTTVTFGSGTSSNDFSNVTTWTHAFYLANSLTSLEFPTNMSFASVTSGGMSNFLTGGTMTDAQYDNLLVRFEATNSVNPGGAFRVNAYYTSGGAGETARTALIARGWTFTDLGGR
tara:strand:+ start:2691 stop:4487 length:1797 start_codon:yes stop_codon:yes gene_type:complete